MVRCDCMVDHDRPAGVKAGCGRFWLGTLTGGLGAWQLHAETDRSILPAARALEDAVAEQDKQVQASAEKWLAGITAVFGLFTLSGVVTPDKATEGLSAWGKVWVALALVAATAAAATALGLGYGAAYGWPRPVDVSTKKKLEAWFRQRRAYAETASAKLRFAILTAFGALFLLVVAVALLWFLPRTLTTAKT
jgi:hypothetical protein